MTGQELAVYNAHMAVIFDRRMPPPVADNMPALIFMTIMLFALIIYPLCLYTTRIAADRRRRRDMPTARVVRR